MTNQTIIPKHISSRNEYKHKFSLSDMYKSFVFVPRAITILISNKKTNLVNGKFINRLQLAVTEVNGCTVCSYAHAQLTLQQGISNEEINSLLSGGNNFTKPEEAKAILFAQHFADSGAYPKKHTYNAILKEYGEKKTQIILSAIQVITAGNIYGIPLSALQARFKGKTYKNSSLFYELKLLIIGIFIFPIAIINALINYVSGSPNSRFDNND